MALQGGYVLANDAPFQKVTDLDRESTMKEMVFRFEKGANGAWYVTSSDVPGLLASAGTVPDALENAAKAIRDMALAAAIEISEGRPASPIFVHR